MTQATVAPDGATVIYGVLVAAGNSQPVQLFVMPIAAATRARSQRLLGSLKRG